MFSFLTDVDLFILFRDAFIGQGEYSVVYAAEEFVVGG